MPKITLTAEEEIQYLRELDRMQEIMPELEIQVVSQPGPSQGRFVISDTSVGDEFRNFLKANHFKLSFAEVEHK